VGGVMKQISQFLKEVKVELSRVEWPSFDDFLGATIVTLLLVVFFTIFLFLVDWVIRLVVVQQVL
jgi:preprotein translocase subunit SecE